MKRVYVMTLSISEAMLPKANTSSSFKCQARKTNMISAITNQGKVRFHVYDDNMKAGILIDFMRRLIKDSGRKVYLLLDNLRVHHAKIVKAGLEKNKNKTEVFYLSAYSLEIAPDECLNCDLKTGVHSSVPARNKDQRKKKWFLTCKCYKDSL